MEGQGPGNFDRPSFYEGSGKLKHQGEGEGAS